MNTDPDQIVRRTDQEILESAAALRNSSGFDIYGEKEYGERPLQELQPDGDIMVYAADGQEICNVPLITDPENYEREIADAICHAGNDLVALLLENADLRARLAKADLDEHG